MEKTSPRRLIRRATINNNSQACHPRGRLVLFGEQGSAVMRDELLAYLFNDADPEQRQRIEHHLAHDPTWQHEFERLKKCIEAYNSDPQGTECPPEDLVHRTCSFVQGAVLEGGCSSPEGATPASLSESSERSAKSRQWSLADLAVGLGIVLVLGTLLLPALHESRDAARRAKCQDNLREIGGALVKYAERDRRGLPHIGYHENAGMFVVELASSGIIHPKVLAERLLCPGTQLADDVFHGRVLMKVLTEEELGRLAPEALEALKIYMSGSFAYQFGFVDENGKYRPMEFVARGDAPMLADAPSSSVEGFQSANHGGCGQNVLNQDLSCRYLSLCILGRGDHVFLNENGQHAAGRSAHDAVLGRSEASPAGSLHLTQR